MTQEEIIEMAQECGLVGMRPHLDGIYVESLVAFAKLVEEAEREACAKVLDEMATQDKLSNYYAVSARAIRARGQA